MSDPNPEQAPLNSLSDDYIRDLEPENQRYDITLAQDFVVSVLPNGIKTWAFIYDFQGRHRRKTLGVFPEMNFDDAKVALEKARASMMRMDEPTVAPNEFGQLPAVLGGSNYIPKRKKKPFNYIPLLKVLAGVAILGIGALVAKKALEWRAANPTVSEAPAEEPASTSLPFALEKKPTPAESTQDPVTPTPTATATTNAADRATTTDADANRGNTNSPQATAPSARQPAPEIVTAPVNTNSSEPAAASIPVRVETPPVTSLTTTTKATAFGGRVARSVLTSRVEELEPTDTLGPEISYKNSGFTRVFYYTELREFGDGNVVHRWSLNGNVIDEVALKVNKSWRWRTYSNKDITPGLNGEWKVETIDATGKILDSKTFTYDYQ